LRETKVERVSCVDPEGAALIGLGVIVVILTITCGRER
jgi:hypothetical protein